MRTTNDHGPQAQRPRGRPVKNKMPEPIPDTPENVARAIMRGPPRKEWDYLKAAGKKPLREVPG